MEMVSNDKYEAYNKLMTQESDIEVLKLRGDNAIKGVKELQERLK